MTLIPGGGGYLEMAPAVSKHVVGRAPAEGEYAMSPLFLPKNSVILFFLDAGFHQGSLGM